ncbi:hypothetical protein P43SY_009889 [Pythium insidiosum]|uniref:RING-type domain-containing protein n=1 Tax=Pythium insidiosum TaxID=114742 RepID=A0AAD5L8N0_PYTIN|nr:hypothetical protein P43SY_009889 [Pythium insidiosum]
MIKKNVLGAASSRPGGGMKRGLAVVEYFKQQQQQLGDGGETPSAQGAAKRKKESHAASLLASAAVSTPSAKSGKAAVSAAAIAAANIILSPARRASPLRGGAVGFTSPSRRLPSRPLPDFSSPTRRVTTRPIAELVGAVAPLDRLAASTTTPLAAPSPSPTTAASTEAGDLVTPLKPNAPPSKSPFESFQSKLSQPGRQPLPAQVLSPSPRRATPPLIPTRRTSSPAQSRRGSAGIATPEEDARRLPPRSGGPRIAAAVVDLSDTSTSAPDAHQQTEHKRSASLKDADNKAPSSGAVAPKSLARSLFSSASNAATKSICFSTEAVASSIDVSNDGECIVVAFTDGSVRLYEMDSTVPSDRHGYLLGHLDEESNQSSAGAHLRVKISQDGRYTFVGCRSGPRVMMSIHLDHYRNGKDTDDDDVDQLQKSFHSNTRLRGFSDVTPCSNPGESMQDRVHSYYLLCGLGIGTLNMWHFVEHARAAPEWKHLYAINTNGNTAIIASFMPRVDSGPTMQVAARCEDKNLRVWNLEEDDGKGYHVVQSHYDLQGTKDVTTLAGTYAYGIAPTGEPYRFLIPPDGTSSTPPRTFFDMERHDMLGGSSSKSRRATIILESIFASDDGQCVVAVSAEGIFYYTKSVQEGSDGGMLKIIGRNSSLNTQFKTPPMKVYRPRRLKGERQMRRLWKQRETEFESQLQEATSKLDAAEKELTTLRESQRDAEKRFIFEKLKAEQQSSVKAQYEQLCEKMQERMTALEHQQRVMETTTRTLLQEVDRHVQHSKQSVKSLVDRQQNECVLCKEHPAVTAIVPCGHLCFCEDDAETYRRNFQSGDQVVCPICQREMISMLRIY